MVKSVPAAMPRLVLGVVLGLALGAALLAAPAPAVRAQADGPPRTPVLLDVTASHRDGTDRVVFRFRDSLPQVRVRYVDRLFADGSGRRVRVAGRAVLQVSLEPAAAHTDDGRPTGAPRRRAFALPNVVTAVRAGDFEGVVTYGIGLARRTPAQVTTLRNPSRVVVSFRADLPTTRRLVYFLDRENFVTGTDPYFVPRIRRVPVGSPATGVMDRLFAGPTERERAQGLRLVLSGTTGYDDLAISDGTARVRLLGRCTSRGSTVTIAGSILPALRQFDTVERVKIHDRDDHTQDPTGPGDSTPECLEP